MKILQRYLIKTIIQAIVMVVVILAGLELFILFVNELEDIGNGNYGLVEAFLYVLLQLPLFVYQFFPFASLLGCLLGLGVLASNNELTVMRSAGLSIRRIAGAVIFAAVCLLAVATALGELAAPPLQHYANQRKAIATSGGQALQTAQGLWLRDGQTFIHIDQVQEHGPLQGIRSYRFDKDLHLEETLYAKQGQYENKQWLLHDVSISRLGSQQVSSQHYATYPWSLSLAPSLLRVTATEPEELSLGYLYRYIQSHAESFGEVGNYKLAFWSRVLQPLATCVMMLLALPFLFGSQRNVTMGARLVLGLVIGFSFHTLNQFFGPISLVMQVPPALAASLPTILFAFTAMVLIRRI